MNKAVRLTILLLVSVVLVIITLNFQHKRFSEARRNEVLEDLQLLPVYRHDRGTALRILDAAHAEVFPWHYRLAGWGFPINTYRRDVVESMKLIAQAEGRPELLDEFDALVPFVSDARAVE